MLIPLTRLGSVGIIKDMLPHELPPQAWSDGQNVCFRDGVVGKFPGHSLFTSLNTLPYAIFGIPQPGGNSYWMFAAKDKVTGYCGGTAVDITRAAGAYTGGDFDRWNGGLFNGFPIINNGVDTPQVWSPVGLGQPLVDLPNWPASATAKILRGFKQFLVGLDITKVAGRNRRLVKWSHSAAPASIPVSWDETDPTLDAGEQQLTEGDDSIVDCCPLGDVNAIYTETQCWIQSLSGGFSIFNFNKRFDTLGLLAQDCVKPFKPRQHFVVTQDDFVVHDGTDAQSVATSRIRDWVFRNLNSTAYSIAFVIPFYKKSEMWFCFPFQGGGLVNMAAIWNWQFNTWTIVDLPDIRAGVSTRYATEVSSLDLFDFGSSGPIDTDSSKFDVFTGRPLEETILLASVSPDNKIFQQDPALWTRAGSNFSSYVARTGLAVVGMNSQGEPVSDRNVVKMVTALWPEIDAPAGTVFELQLWTKMTPQKSEEPIVWGPVKQFTVGTDVKCDIYGTGRFYGYRLSCNYPVEWKLRGLGIDVVPLGAL